jgi:proton-dependent oligopeptide transporter, POT family
MSQSTTGHPKGLYVLFVTEMWERFSYYGMRAIFTLYMTKALLFDKALGSDIYGSYTGLVYLTPLLGGYMADRYWGNRKSIIIGGFLMAIGQFLMFASGSLYQDIGLSSMIMYTGLAFLIFGNGFFKPNISTMVGQLYPQGDKRVDSAFTIFYMGINLGAFLSPLVCGTLGDTGNPEDFKWGFLAAGVGMLLSTLLFIWLKDHYIVTPDGTPIGTAPNQSRKTDTPPIDTAVEVKKDFSMQQILTWAGVEVGLFILFYLLDFGVIGSFIFSLTIAAPGFIISDRSLNKEERERIWVIYIIAFFVIFFWAAFEQAGASLTYFAEEQTDRTVNLTLSKTFLLGLIAVVVGILAWLFNKVLRGFKNEQRGVKELFMLLLGGGIAYGIYSIFQLSDEGIYIEQIPTSFFQSINAIAIVIFAPLFALLWTWMGNKNIEPASPYKQAIGLFLLAVGYAVIAIGVKDVTAKVSMMWLVSLYTIHTFGELCLSPIGLSMVNKLAPVKFASLLMGVWFLSTSAANKFAGVLSGLYPENGVSKQFIGFQITDLYDFFMIFVVMAGVAAVILFLLSSKLLKMMHGVR